MREFTLVHLSDLHIGKASADSLRILSVGLRMALGDVPPSLPRLLIITGDITDSPTGRNLKEAREFIDSLSSLFKATVVVPGNHDLKRLFGSFLRSSRFELAFAEEPVCLDRELGVHLIGVNSTRSRFARGRVTAAEHDGMVIEYYKSEANDIAAEERRGFLRIVGLHHHPLPLAAGEDKRVLGDITDEEYMYLESPARFLDACVSCDVSIILHGHRHVAGLVRYSTEVHGASIAEGEDLWSNLYVVSCPSSTGQTCDAGFNVLSFHLGRCGTYCDLERYRRLNNQGQFETVRTSRGNHKCRLALWPGLSRDVRIDVKEKVQSLPTDDAGESELFPLAKELFNRDVFHFSRHHDWPRAVYTYGITRQIWCEEFVPRLRDSKKQVGEAILEAVCELERFVADAFLGMGKEELAHVWQEYEKTAAAFIRRMPAQGVTKPPSEENLKKHRRMLRFLAQKLETCGVGLPYLGDTWEEHRDSL